MAWVMTHAPASLNGTEQSVALALANYAADDGGSAFPSIKTLSEITHWSERTVQGALRSLTEKGVIELQEEATNKRPATYAFPMYRGAFPAPPERARGADGAFRGAANDARGAANAVRGAGAAPDPSLTVIEPSGNHQHLPPSRGAYTQEFEEFWKPYPATNGSKADAFKAWKQLSAEDRAAAVAALPVWLGCEQWRSGYVKHAGAWLRGRLWEVAPTAKRASPPGGSNGRSPEDRRPEIKPYTGVERKSMTPEKLAEARAWREQRT